MTDGLSQAERTLRVLELLGESAEAWASGDKDRMKHFTAEAIEVDAFAVSGIRGGIMIGEIPDPINDPHAWLEYLNAMRDEVAGEVNS